MSTLELLERYRSADAEANSICPSLQPKFQWDGRLIRVRPRHCGHGQFDEHEYCFLRNMMRFRNWQRNFWNNDDSAKRLD